ncbi:MAG TPA: hypothetical protein VKE41_23085 [Roseiflexaceae bacterium]|nr:hypothetical protein [Roseiflexaceae bacterium]
MPDPLAQTLHDWGNFYMLAGAASATLTGLMFVAISLGAGLVNERATQRVRTFVTPMVVNFAVVLVIALLIAIPTLTRLKLGVVLALLGLSGIGYIGITCFRMLYRHEREQLDRQHWVWHFLLPGLSYLLVTSTAVWLLLSDETGLDQLAIAIALLLVVGIRNAWNVTLWIAQRR